MTMGQSPKLAVCACGKPATANGRECSVHFLARLRSIRIDTSRFESPGHRANYYDKAAVVDQFGADAEDRMMEQTKGLGAAFTGPDGETWRHDRKSGEPVRVTERELEDVYLGGPIIDES